MAAELETSVPLIARSSSDPLPTSNEPLTSTMILLCAGAGIPFFLFGYDTGVVSTAMTWARRDLGLGTIEDELVVSVTVASAAVFALIAGPLNQGFGRHLVIQASGLLFIAGSSMIALSSGFGLLVVGRLVLGAAIGLGSTTVPLYVAESAPAERRGVLVATQIALVVLGQASGALLNAALERADGLGPWRLTMGLAAAPPLAQLAIFASCLPESPRVLLASGDRAGARAALLRLRPSAAAAVAPDGGAALVDAELDEMARGVAADERAAAEAIEARERLRARGSTRDAVLAAVPGCWMFAEPALARALALGVGLQTYQQLSGINTVMYYSTTIFEMAGFSSKASAWLTVLCAATQLLGVALTVALALPDTRGRRATLLASSQGAALALLVLAAGFWVELHTSGSAGNILTVLGVEGYLLAFGLGLAPIPWCVNAEIYPLRARAPAQALATFANWAANFFVSVTFLSLCAWLGGPIAFLVFFGVTVAGMVLVYAYMPETKGRSLEQISQLFEEPYTHDRKS